MKKARDKGERQRMREEMKSLRKELIQREKTAIKQILKKADVVLATMTSASADGPLKLLDLKHFDLGVIDECSQVSCFACSHDNNRQFHYTLDHLHISNLNSKIICFSGVISL